MSIITTGTCPELVALVPSVVTVAPRLGRATLTVLSGSPLPIGEAAALRQAGVYILLQHRPNEMTDAYVGMSGAISDRLATHERLRPNTGTVQVIGITSDGDDLDKSDARVLERLLYTALGACADVHLLNEEPPFHGRQSEDRYGQLRVFLGDALCRLAESGLIQFHSPLIDLLAGPELAFDDMLDRVDATALVDAERRQFARRGIVAEALFLTNGWAVLKGGSQIRSLEAPTLHGGISALRNEALFSGLVAPNAGGVLTLGYDLTFGSWNSMAQFVTASSSGQVPLWRSIEPHQADSVALAPTNHEADLLALWRTVPVPAGDDALAEELRAVMSRVAPFGAVNWSQVADGDLSAAVKVAVKLTSAAQPGPATRDVDLAMSAIFACAVLGKRGATELLDTLMFRLAAKGVPIAAPIQLGARL